jgi:hypothetical protein
MEKHTILHPCAAIHNGHRCGLAPTLTECTRDGNQVLQVRCACGNHGGSVFYIKPSDAERTRQATCDGWNAAQ